MKIINEGIISASLPKAFKGFGFQVAAKIENLIKKSFDDTILSAGKNTTKISVSSIKNNKNYKDAFFLACEEASLKTEKKTFSDLMKDSREKADNILLEVDTTFKKRLNELANSKKITITQDAKSTQITKVDNTKLNNTSVDLELDSKMEAKGKEAEKTINSLPPQTQATYTKMLVDDTVVVATGTGAQVAPTIKKTSKFTIKNALGFFKVDKAKLANFTGKVRRIKLKKKTILTLSGLGITVPSIYILYQKMFPSDTLIIEDENGNDIIEDKSVSEFAPCIQNLINAKEGKLFKSITGGFYVRVINDVYPDGLDIFTNGRLFDRTKRKKGSWSCKSDGIIKENKQLKFKKIIRNVLNEQLVIDKQMNSDVNLMIDYLDFPVYGNDLKNAYNLLNTYAKKNKGKEFLRKYEKSGLATSSLKTSVESVFVSDPTSVDYKENLIKLINQIQGGKTSTEQKPSISGSGLSQVDIKWDVSKVTDAPQKVDKVTKTATTQKVKYVDCEKNGFPYVFGCINSKIAEIQGCLNIAPQKGYFGNKTRKTLISMGYDLKNGITQEIYNKVIENCGTTDGETYQPTMRPDDGTLGYDNLSIKPLKGKTTIDTSLPTKLSVPDIKTPL